MTQTTSSNIYFDSSHVQTAYPTKAIKSRMIMMSDMMRHMKHSVSNMQSFSKRAFCSADAAPPSKVPDVLICELTTRRYSWSARSGAFQESGWWMK